MTEQKPNNEGSDARLYRIEGRVQGVGFRWWTHQMASQMGLRGTVRNLRDGSVEIRVAGPVEVLDELESRLDRGPTPARVALVERSEQAPEVERDGFEIVR